MTSPQHHDDFARLLVRAGHAVIVDRLAEGESLIGENWPHTPRVRAKRRATETKKLSIWIKDGFRCRYSGDLLLFPAFMTIMSALFPDTFPAHKNGKAEFAHDAYWTHFASLEHIEPTSIGGRDEEDNWITTSMARNQVRSRYPLESLGWTIRPREPLLEWDGGLHQFLNIIDQHPELRDHADWGAYIGRWERTTKTVLG